MSGARIPYSSFGQALRDVILALIVMISVILLWQGGRIQHDCQCSAVTGVAIRWAAGGLLAAFLIWLVWPAIRAWRGLPHQLGPMLGQERHHVVAALVPWVMAILGVALLTVPAQTADMLAGLQGDTFADIVRPVIPFGLGALAWGLATWFCGRWLIDVERQASGRPETALALWNPRAIALITGYAIITVTVNAAGLCSYAVWVGTAVAAIVLLFAVFRRPVARMLRARRGAASHPPSAPPHQSGTRRLHQFPDDLRAAPGGMAAVLIASLLSVIVIGMFALFPLTSGRLLQAPGTVLLGIACLTMIATFVWRLGACFPYLGVLLVLIIVTTLLGPWNIGVDHDIRTLGAASVAAAPSPTLEAAAEDWLHRCGPALIEPAGKELKVVLVSTAGGASRAALWTFNALSDLQDVDPQLPRRVFTVSAVSGGALGATVWSALLARENFDCSVTITDTRIAQTRRAAGQQILGHDFLAPALAVALSRDVILGLLPLNIVLRPLQIGDRSATLEQAWEAAWATEPGEANNLLAANFMSLWNGTFNRPILLLNGTVEDTGEPIVTAPIAIVDRDGRSYGDLPATYDARWLLHDGIRTSTAILDAARFPVITSQGDIRVRLCPDGSNFAAAACTDHATPADRVVSVVDGGYFDNLGGGTTVMAAAALTKAFTKLQERDKLFGGVRLRIMVVGINSDPNRLISAAAWQWIDPQGSADGTAHAPVDQLMRCGGAPSTLSIGDQGQDNTLDGEIAPALAIIATQSGHTAARMAELNQQFCSPRLPLDPPVPGQSRPTLDAPTNYIMLSLCPIGSTSGSISLPLNWVLSKATLDFFAGKDKSDPGLPDQCGNRRELEDYRDWVASH